MSGSTATAVLRLGVAALVDLVLPSACAGCGATGVRWCTGCQADLEARLFAGGRATPPDPCPAGMPRVRAAGRYAGSLRAAVVAYKDEGRSDLVRLLAPLLAQAMGPWAGVPGLLLVPMPSSPSAVRARGEETTRVLAARAAQVWTGAPGGPHGVPPVCPALRVVRRVRDQSRLGSRERAANVTGAYAVAPRLEAGLRGVPVLLVDDVVTTGATLTEGARALRAAGAVVLGSAVVAATSRSDDRSGAAGVSDDRSTRSRP